MTDDEIETLKAQVTEAAIEPTKRALLWIVTHPTESEAGEDEDVA